MKKIIVACVLVCVAFTAGAALAADAAPKHGLQTVDSAWVKAMLAGDAAALARGRAALDTLRVPARTIDAGVEWARLIADGVLPKATLPDAPLRLRFPAW